MKKIFKPKKFIIFGSPLIENDEIKEVVKTLKSSWLGTGPRVAKFEEDFKQYENAKYAMAVNSCTAALHLSILACGIGEGDEVITTPMTFCATVNTIIHAGATPILADINPQTYNIDPDEIRKKITKRTKAIIPVHFAGRACEMDEIISIASKHNLHIIEDCAHAIETEYHKKKAGTFGRFGCFSFYSTKNVVTGEGGMVLAKNSEDASKIKILGLHGMSKDAWKRFGDTGFKHYQVVECGYKYNMMDLQAAIGIHQLKRVDQNWLKREKIWKRYNHALKELPIGLPADIEKNTKHAYHLYTILVDKKKTSISRDDFLDQMTKKGVGVGVHYMSVPEHEYYQRTFGWKPEEYPNAMMVGRQTVSIPISPKLTDMEVEYIIKSIKEIIDNAMVENK
jgi:dTDP-4-amino-4,6-dideoxygalactose transaminase